MNSSLSTCNEWPNGFFIASFTIILSFLITILAVQLINALKITLKIKHIVKDIQNTLNQPKVHDDDILGHILSLDKELNQVHNLVIQVWSNLLKNKEKLDEIEDVALKRMSKTREMLQDIEDNVQFIITELTEEKKECHETAL